MTQAGAGTAAAPRGEDRSLLGVTRALASKLAQLGVRREFDLVLHLPLRYEDETRLTPIEAAPPGSPVQIEGVVESVELVYRPRRQLIVRLRDKSGEAVMRFFNFYASQLKALERARGERVRAFGEIRRGFFGGEMIHPRYRVLSGEAPLPKALTPVYPSTAGLAQHVVRRLIERALEREQLDETVPEELIRRHRFVPFAQAILALHRPKQGESVRALGERTHPAWKRVKFDELLAQQISMRKHYRLRKAKAAPALRDSGTLARALIDGLPFRLTRAQQRAWREIGNDLGEPHPMHRLLQGDVGSGKTVVAALAALRATENGLQTAVMAPTEILAEQHYRKFSDWLLPLGVRLAWLTGSQTKKERAAALADIAQGGAALAIGTHALFQEGVAFRALGLAIVDEQHRFGVAQRLALRETARRRRAAETLAAPFSQEPHLLMMSATPIPRTLSMSYYADLDVSLIDEMPPGRRPVLTKLVASNRRDEVLRRVREACAAGEQAYWVCPLIEDIAAKGDTGDAHADVEGGSRSAAFDLQSVIDTHARIAREFPEFAVGMVHGRLASAEKTAVMEGFAAGKIQLLVATTVIEVGVDVPTASLMVIEHAERFGLAQLHQLRGRIGRGGTESVCVLLYQNPLSEAARRRLKVIYENSDGFAIAREDLKLRGPGEYLGARQSGMPLLRFADLSQDEALLEAAREAAQAMLDRHPKAAERHLQRWLGARADFMWV